MNKPAQLHSRLDFAQEPTPRGCWARSHDAARIGNRAF